MYMSYPSAGIPTHTLVCLGPLLFLERRMWFAEIGDLGLVGIMGVAITSCVSLIGAVLLFRKQKVTRDTNACFGRIEQAGFHRYDAGYDGMMMHDVCHV